MLLTLSVFSNLFELTCVYVLGGLLFCRKKISLGFGQSLHLVN